MAHHIEERAVVYLRLNDEGTAWEIDAPTNDGHALEGYDNGAINDGCDCETKTECDAAVEAAWVVDLPDSEQLLRMLAESLGLLVLAPGPNVPGSHGRTDETGRMIWTAR